MRSGPVAACLFAIPAAVCVQAQTVMPAMVPGGKVVGLEVTVNGESGGMWPFVEENGMLYTSREALDSWRVKVRPKAMPIMVKGEEYWPLGAIPGYSVKMHYDTQTLELSFAPESFDATRLTAGGAPRPKPNPVMPSAFVNYDVNYTAARGGLGASSNALNAAIEVGASNQFGEVTSTFVGANLLGHDASARKWTRLETSATHVVKDTNYLLRIGDSGTRTGLWGRTVYFGGVQFGTNYALTPWALTRPVPIFSGVSSSPSTVELYVNDVLRQVSKVPTGPFTIDNSLTLVGAGEARMVVRDVLGREVITTQPFFADGNLLSKGLSDWGVEAGVLRRDFGLASAHYGTKFASGTWRFGASDTITIEGRAEATRATKAVGAGAILRLPGDALGRGAIVASRDEVAGNGMQWIAGAQKNWSSNVSANLEMEGASEGFRLIGQDHYPSPRFRATANASYTGSTGTLGFAVSSSRMWGGFSITTLSANYSMALAGQSRLSVNVAKAMGDASGTSVAVTLSIPLGDIGTTASVSTGGGQVSSYVSAVKAPGKDSDWGWRVLGSHSANATSAEGGVSYQGRFGNLNADVSASTGNSALRVAYSGGIALADGHLFAGRRLDQGFALVELKDIPDVRVGVAGVYTARTDAGGYALVPNLAPLAANEIRLHPEDLPAAADIASIEQIVVPPFRGAVKAVFPVRSGRSALVKVVMEDGLVAPAGAQVAIDNDSEEFIVARNGSVYVTGLKNVNTLLLRDAARTCRISLELPPETRDEVLKLGPVVCKGTDR